MKENVSNRTLLQVSLIAGITILSYVGAPGWGWLIFALILTL